MTMKTLTYTDELYHHGILGQKWGKRNGPPYPLDPSDRSAAEKRLASDSFTAYRESSVKIHTNSDGSKTLPKGFVLNRVGKDTMDIKTNPSGGLYVSYGKSDAARYVKIYGPDLLNTLFHNTREAIQHISVQKSLRLASDEQFVSSIGEYLNANPDFSKRLQADSFYGMYLDKKETKLTSENIERMIRDPSNLYSKQIAWSVNTMFIDQDNRLEDVKSIYEYFRKKGFDAIPDLHDTWDSTSETAMIIINPSKLRITETTRMTKDIFKAGKEYVKTLEPIPVSEAVKSL